MMAGVIEKMAQALHEINEAYAEYHGEGAPISWEGLDEHDRRLTEGAVSNVLSGVPPADGLDKCYSSIVLSLKRVAEHGLGHTIGVARAAGTAECEVSVSTKPAS